MSIPTPVFNVYVEEEIMGIHPQQVKLVVEVSLDPRHPLYFRVAKPEPMDPAGVIALLGELNGG